MGSLIEVDAQTANSHYCRLPLSRQVSTLGPAYVMVDALRDATLRPIFLLHKENDKFWLLSAHASSVPNSDYIAIASPYPYGGPLANTDDADFTGRAWELYKRWCHEHLVLADIFKLHPLVLHPYGGSVKFNRYVYLAGETPTQKCRNIINKAKARRLLCTQMDRSFIAQHFPIDYRESMIDMKADPFYLFNDVYFDALSKLDGAVLLVCGEEEKWRSACIMLGGGTTMEYHLSITSPRGREIGAGNFMIFWARERLRGDHKLYLGGGRTPSERDSLAKFKASFGGDAMAFNIGWQIHRPDVYNEMKIGINNGKVLFWK